MVYTGDTNPILPLGRRMRSFGLSALDRAAIPKSAGESLSKVPQGGHIYIMDPQAPARRVAAMHYEPQRTRRWLSPRCSDTRTDWFFAPTACARCPHQKGDVTSKNGASRTERHAVNQYPRCGHAQFNVQRHGKCRGQSRSNGRGATKFPRACRGRSDQGDHRPIVFPGPDPELLRHQPMRPFNGRQRLMPAFSTAPTGRPTFSAGRRRRRIAPSSRKNPNQDDARPSAGDAQFDLLSS